MEEKDSNIDEFIAQAGQFDIQDEVEAVVFLTSACYANMKINAIERGDGVLSTADLVIATAYFAIEKSPLWSKYHNEIIESGTRIIEVMTSP